MKKRLGRSPNRADAIVLSFAYPVTKKQKKEKTKQFTSFNHGEGWMG